MKQRTSFFIVLLSFFVVSAFAKPSDLEFQSKAINSEFSKVDKLEQYLETHPQTTLEEIKKTHPELLSGFELIATTNETNFSPTKKMPLVGGFWWGCCLGIVGLGLVYFITDNDKGQVRSALLGCIITTILFGIGGFWDPFNWF